LAVDRLYRGHRGSGEHLADGISPVGDLLRVGHAAGCGHGDSSSTAAAHDHAPTAAHVGRQRSAGEIVLLDSAYELDDAPRRTVYFVPAGGRSKVAPRWRRARGRRPTPLPAGLEQVTFAVQKEVRK
jgi:hypothetical protein